MGLFRSRNTQNRRYLCSFGNYSVHSAPDSRMNRMGGIRFTRNRQNTRSFGKFLAGKTLFGHVQSPRFLTLKYVWRKSSSQVTSAMGIPFPDLGVFFSKLKFRVFYYSKRIARIAPKECTLNDGHPAAGIRHCYTI